MIDWQAIADELSLTLNREIRLENPSSVGGGCINQAWQVRDQNHQFYFIKTNKPSKSDMFEAEFEGLQAIADSQTIRCPKPYLTGQQTSVSYIIMEHIPLYSCSNMEQMGAQLANMHQFHAKQYGWHRDNTIGSTHQPNNQSHDWPLFWKEHRLLFQLNLAKNKGLSTRDYDAGLLLSENLHHFFDNYTPDVSLLHGDLWGGNCSQDSEGNPVIYDPAVYFGDRETDLAMMQLFGGFSEACFSSYNEHYPIDQGFSIRQTLYNLYHILNHFNLFGSSYASQASGMIERLNSQY